MDIKGRIDTLINYAANPEKTEGQHYSENQIKALHDVMDYASDDYKTERSLYVSGVNTTPDTAKQKMHQTKLRYGKMDVIVAFHAIQSFKPGETTPDIAHEIGKKLAKEMWGDRFEVVIATHLNKEHLHNHFVINSVSFADGKKYYDNTANYNLMKKISDRLCAEYNLSVILLYTDIIYINLCNKYIHKFMQQILTFLKMLCIIIIGDNSEYDYRYNFKREKQN